MHVNPDWTLDELQRAYDTALATGSFGPDAPPKIDTWQAQWTAYQYLKQLNVQFDAGNTQALMYALDICAANALVMPAWVATGYQRAFRDVHDGRADTWDAAFGRPFPKGRHPEAVRKERDLVFKVWLAVCESQKRENPPPIDDSLFETIATQIKSESGIEAFGTTLAKNYYRMAKQDFGPAGGTK